MINYKDYFIFSLLERKALTMFGKKLSFCFYDKRIKEVFKKLLSQNVKPVKYYFTENTMERVKPIDLTNCYPTKLGYLFDKYTNEFGVCICKENNIGFIYQISINDIKIIVTSGTRKSANPTADRFGRMDYAPFNKTIVGSAIISFHNDSPSIMPNNTLSFVLNYNSDIGSGADKTTLSEMIKISKILQNQQDKKKPLIEVCKDEPHLKNHFEDNQIKTDKIWLAIKMFIFLKTAKVVEKTFVSDSKEGLKYPPLKKENDKEYEDEGIIVVDSRWDSSIKVINPFSVSGHFREQPKKNEKKQWYKEVIYIDSFLKTGYTRKAKMEKEIEVSKD